MKKESISAYAKRFCELIKEENAIIIGLSFGGMMAVELSKIKRFKKIILISSAKGKNEIAWYYRWIGKLGIHRLFSGSCYKRSNAFVYWLFGIKEKEEKRLLEAILNDADPTFFYWAIDKIVTWKNEDIPHNIFHIHGTADRLLPLRFVKADAVIQKGGHFMVYNKAKEILNILRVKPFFNL